MKKIIIGALCGLILSGCTARQNNAGNTAAPADRAANNSAAAPENRTNAVPNAAGSPSPAGERIENEQNVVVESNGWPAGWSWIDPESRTSPVKYETKSGAIAMIVPSGRDLYGENLSAPRLVRAVTGDFEFEAEVGFDPREVYQGAGILVFRNDSNYLRLERGFGGVAGGENGVRFDMREDEVYEPIATQEKFPTAARRVGLKIRRSGREFTAFWREPGGDWREVGKYTGNYPETVQVGIIACNTAADVPVEFANLKLSPVK